LPTQKRFEVRNSNLPNPQSVSSSSDNSSPIGNRKSAIGNKVNKAPTSPITDDKGKRELLERALEELKRHVAALQIRLEAVEQRIRG